MELVPVEYCASRFSVAVENRSIIAVLAPDLYQNDDPWGDSLLNCEQREEVSRLALERFSQAVTLKIGCGLGALPDKKTLH